MVVAQRLKGSTVKKKAGQAKAKPKAGAAFDSKWMPVLKLREHFSYTDEASGQCDLMQLFVRKSLRKVLGRIGDKDLQALLESAEILVSKTVRNEWQNVIRARDEGVPVEIALYEFGLSPREEYSDEPFELLNDAMWLSGEFENLEKAMLMFAAFGMWCINEYSANHDQKMLVAAVRSLNRAQYLSGRIHGLSVEKHQRSLKSQRMNDNRHAGNRERTKKAFEWYKSQTPIKRSVAAKEIARRYHVEIDVAKKWVDDFSKPNYGVDQEKASDDASWIGDASDSSLHWRVAFLRRKVPS